jgi:TfoX/Sxy family transcriptional regulator of competence genes
VRYPMPDKKEKKTISMPRFSKAPAEVVARFREAVEGLPALESRTMFGYPCAFVHGQMFAGVFADRMMVRLAERDRAELLALPGARPFEPVAGRVMREYVELPPEIALSAAKLRPWFERGLAFAGSLPPKVKKPRAR